MDLPWILATVSLLLLATAGVLWLRFGRTKVDKRVPTKWPLTARRIFSPDEQRVHRTLREALPNHLVLPKLPLVRFCQPSNHGELRYWYEVLGTQRVSFAICTEGGRVLAAIDLKGLRPASRRSQQIKESVLAACKVKYLHCAAEELPSLADLRALVPEPASKSVPVARMAQASEQLSATVAERRRERQVFADSSFVADSFFDEIAAESAVSGFGRSNSNNRLGVGAFELDLPLDKPGPSVLVDTVPAPALRS